MAEPTNFFFITTTLLLIPRMVVQGQADSNYNVININTDKLIFTGGGIEDSVLTTPTMC